MATSENPFMGAEKLRCYLRDRTAELVGTSDLEEGNRRLEVVESWRREDAE